MAIQFAERVFRGESATDAERRSILQAIDDLADKAQAEGYSRSLLAPGAHLLIEVECDDGKGSANAVDYASLSFAYALLFRQGVGAAGVPVEYTDSLADQGYKFAWDLFNLVKKYQHESIDVIPFSTVPLPLSFPSLPREIVAKPKRRPPAAEIEYMNPR